MTKRKFLSVVIPVYNEERRLGNLHKVSQYLKRQKYKSEIILVNDGSTDRTLKALKELAKKIDFRLFSYKRNRGKGFAIKTGMLEAKGDYRLFSDIDLSTPIEEFDKFFRHLEKYHIIIGSRKLGNSKLRVRQPRLREYLGQGFTLLSQIALNAPVSDFTCGFKCFSRDAAEKIFSLQKIERWGFDSEIVFIARRLGFTIKEIPVTWSNDTESKVKLPEDIFRSFVDLATIRCHHLKGVYRV